jgi:peptide subunit release factor 1 (eRF1)
MPICKAIVIAGSSTFKGKKKKKLQKMFILIEGELELDCRLAPLVSAVVSVQYSGVNGLNEAISKTRHVLGSLELVAEIDLLSSFFARLAQNQPAAFGLKHIADAIAGSAIEVLILSEKSSDMILCTMSDGSQVVCKPSDSRVLLAASSVLLTELRNKFDVRVVSGSSREGAQFEGLS